MDFIQDINKPVYLKRFYNVAVYSGMTDIPWDLIFLKSVKWCEKMI